MRFLPSLLRFAVLALLGASVVHAHDPYESWANATLHPDRLEVEITMAQSTALRLLDPKAAFPQVTPENFAAFRERLKAQAALLFVVTSLRAPLVPRSVDAEVTEELDIVFKIVFPRPAAGRLHFYASFLRKIGEGYGGNIFVTDPAGKDLGWDQISWENPGFEITVPAVPSQKKS